MDRNESTEEEGGAVFMDDQRLGTSYNEANDMEGNYL